MDTNGYSNLTMDQIQSVQGLSPRLIKNGHFLKTNHNLNLPSNLKIENDTLEQSLVNSYNNMLMQRAGRGDLLGAAARGHDLDLSQFDRYNEVNHQDTESRLGCAVKEEVQDDSQWTQNDAPVPPDCHHTTIHRTRVPPGEDLNLPKTKTDDLSIYHKSNTTSKSLVMGEFTCYRCQLSFTTCRLLRQHAKQCGDSKGCHACPRCPYTCQSASILKIHERTHTGEKPYACKLCDYKSGQKNNVAKHALVHLQQKPHRCRFCEYSAAQKNNLVVHERTHTGIKPYKCTHCDYRTVQKPNLDKHMYLHTDNKPYTCDRCPYRCVQKANLLKHRRRHVNQADHDDTSMHNEGELPATCDTGT